MVIETAHNPINTECRRKNNEIANKLHGLQFFELPADNDAKLSLFAEYFQRPSTLTNLLQTIQYNWREPPIVTLGENIEIRDVDTKKLNSYSSALCPKLVPDTLSSDLIPFAVATVFLKNHAQHSDVSLSGIPVLDEVSLQTLSQSLAMKDKESIPEYLDRIRETLQTPDSNQRLVLNLVEVAGYIDRLLTNHPKMKGRKIFAMYLMSLAFDALADFERFKSENNLEVLTVNDVNRLCYPERNHPPDSFVTILKNRWPNLVAALPRDARGKRLKILEALGVNPINLTLEDDTHVLDSHITGIFAFPHKDGYRNPNTTYNWGEMALLHFILENSPDSRLYTLSDSRILAATLPNIIPSDKLFDALRKFSSSVFGVGIIDIDRTKPVAGIRNITRTLKDNGSIIIAPEGDGWVSEMIYAMPGIGFLAKASEKPIIPVTFREEKLPNGSYKYAVIIHPALNVWKNAPEDYMNAVHHAVAMISASSLEPSERGIYGNEKIMRRLKVFEVLADYPQTKKAEMEEKLGFSFS